MSACLIFQILCFYLVLDDVSSECDRTNGPLGLTDCVFSPQEGKYQAAVCLPRTISSLNKHVTCTGKTTNFCWYLCDTAPSHGGLSACHCDPNSKAEKKISTLDKICYLPTEDCSWFSKCLKKKYDCRSITQAEKRCKRLKNIKENLILSKFALGWISKVTSCIQRDLVHLLYPQIISDCEKIGETINWSTDTCYYEPHSGMCKFTVFDVVTLFFTTFETNPFHCNFQKTVPEWAKLLVFYVKNDTQKDKNTLANEFGEALSEIFNWEKSCLTYKSMVSETANYKSKLITIRIYLYSETKSLIQAKDVIDNLKKYIEKGQMAVLELEDKAQIFIDHVISCITTECAQKYFSYQTRTIACTLSGGYCLDGNTQRALTCKKTMDNICYQGKCFIGECNKVNIIKRKVWGAEEPRQITCITDKNSPVIWVFIHHTVTGECNNVEDCSSIVRGIQDDHMYNPNKTWDDIGYNFLVGDDGNIYEGQGWGRHGIHAGAYNHKALGVSFIGNFMKKLPDDMAISAVKNLIQCGVDLGYIRTDYQLLGHRAVKDTECPGDKLYNEIKKWTPFKEKPTKK